jgi:hypothetical protein
MDGCSNPALARKLLNVVRVSAGRVAGSDAAMRSHRSKLLSGAYCLGSSTCFPTYNPAELHSAAVMGLGGRPYGFDGNGFPDDRRPDNATRMALAAARPAACAAFFAANMDAVSEVAYGWPAGATHQTTEDCLFGKVS